MSRVCYEMIHLPTVLAGVMMDALIRHEAVESIMHLDQRWGEDQFLYHEVILVGEICLERYISDVTIGEKQEINSDFMLVDYTELSCMLQGELNKWRVTKDIVEKDLEEQQESPDWTDYDYGLEDWLTTSDDIIDAYEAAVEILDNV